MALSKKLREVLTIAFCDSKLAKELSDAIENAGSTPLKIKKGSLRFTPGQHASHAPTGITGIPKNAVINKITVQLKEAYIPNYNASNTGPFNWSFEVGSNTIQNTSAGEFWNFTAVILIGIGSESNNESGVNSWNNARISETGDFLISTSDGTGSGAGPYDVSMDYDIWVEYYEGS